MANLYPLLTNLNNYTLLMTSSICVMICISIWLCTLIYLFLNMGSQNQLSLQHTTSSLNSINTHNSSAFFINLANLCAYYASNVLFMPVLGMCVCGCVVLWLFMRFVGLWFLGVFLSLVKCEWSLEGDVLHEDYREVSCVSASHIVLISAGFVFFMIFLALCILSTLFVYPVKILSTKVLAK